jgi:spore germination cell wall hydrolase CwlJ-like protein
MANEDQGEAGVNNLQNQLNLIVGHVRAAAKALTDWWGGMSDAEKRQQRQRAYSIAACAALFAVGGPLIGHRFDVQKSEEAWRADSAQFASELAADPALRHSARVVMASAEAPVAIGAPRLVNVAFTLPAAPASIPAATPETPAATPVSADASVVARFTSINTHHLDIAEREKAELDCLAQAVYYEARSESIRGQMAVAEVVMNRVNDSRFPKTVCGVVYQGQTREVGCQFTFTCDGSLRIPPSGPAWDRARDIALHVALGLSKPITGHATHYHTDYVNPYWSPGMVKTATVGQHIFYRFPKTTAEWAHARLALGLQTLDGQPVDADELAARALAIAAADPAPAATAPAVQPVTADASTRAEPVPVKIEAAAAPAVPAQPTAVPASIAAIANQAVPHLVLASAETR